jgi:pectin methylesterase-like acyl-CoA thioesterase
VVGTYYSLHLDYHWHVELNINGQLVLRRATMPDRILLPDRKGEFTLKVEKYPGMSYDAWVRFHADENGKISHLTVWHPRLMHHRFEKVSQQNK